MKQKKLISFITMLVMSFGFIGFITVPSSATDNSQNATLIMWTTETEAARTAIIEGIASRFTGATVEVVAVDENELPEQITTAKAGNTLPDVVQLAYEYIGGWVNDGILDATRATTTIGDISNLGGLPIVANPGSSGDSDKYGAVPIDGWVQGIWYRTDLFDAKGLAAPDSYEHIMAAASAFYNVTDPLNPFYGIVIGTDPKAVYTQQCYEHFALANGARALDKNGNAALDTPEQVEALEYYTDLAAYGPKGFNDWDAANQLYLTGKAAMMVYSTFIADDILGLQARPWTAVPDLGSKTGFQASIEGNHSEKATYGQVQALGITVGASDQAEAFIKHILNNDNEYLNWLHMAITGKMPLKQTPAILANWTQNEVFAPYDGLAPAILEGFDNIARWGLIDGNSYSTKIATLYSELIMPKAVVEVISNISDAQTAVTNAQADFKKALGETTGAPGFGVLSLFSLITLAIVFRKKKKF